MRHFSQLTREEVQLMVDRCCDAAVELADSLNLAGLSAAGGFNVYRAIETAIYEEWKKRDD